MAENISPGMPSPEALEDFLYICETLSMPSVEIMFISSILNIVTSIYNMHPIKKQSSSTDYTRKSPPRKNA